MHMCASLKNAQEKAIQPKLSQLRRTRQTKITDFLTGDQLKQQNKQLIEVRRPVEFNKDSYTKCIDLVKDERLKVIVSYPLMSSSTPWHSVGVIRLFNDVNAILRVKKLKEFKYYEFIDALIALKELGLLEVVEGLVVNFRSCESN